MPSREFLTSQICLLMLFAKNKVLAEISEFTVFQLDGKLHQYRRAKRSAL